MFRFFSTFAKFYYTINYTLDNIVIIIYIIYVESN